MLTLAKELNDLIWGPPLLLLLLGTGVYLTLRLRLLQLSKLSLAFRLIFKKETGQGDISSFAALATALAATVGTGNIVGVATAIKAGGPGALFWMWVAGFFGMATKYAEGLLAIKYRVKDENGQMSGGPMYYILEGMGKTFKPLAQFFAFSGILVALFGMGTFTQVNAITSALNNSFDLSPQLSGLILALLVGFIIFGGIQAISKVATKIVPIMAGLYLLACLLILVRFADQLLPTLSLIIHQAFAPTAALAGFSGSLVKDAIQKGIARGIFSNESGLGSAPIAAAAARTDQPVEQGLVSMTGTFIDTLIICTMTGLVILITGQWTSDLAGAPLTQAAFAGSFGQLGSLVLTLSLVLFAFTTILGWNYYGERCFSFLFGNQQLKVYRLLFLAMIALGGFLTLDLVWVLADMANGLMALPNLLALLYLSPQIIAETKAYFQKH